MTDSIQIKNNNLLSLRSVKFSRIENLYPSVSFSIILLLTGMQIYQLFSKFFIRVARFSLEESKISLYLSEFSLEQNRTRKNCREQKKVWLMKALIRIYIIQYYMLYALLLSSSLRSRSLKSSESSLFLPSVLDTTLGEYSTSTRDARLLVSAGLKGLRVRTMKYVTRPAFCSASSRLSP